MKIKNFFILTDLEGVSGVESFSQTREKGPKNDQACDLLTAELNAIIQGIREYNSEIKIHVWDGHGSGGINVEELFPVDHFLPSQHHNQIEYFQTHNIDALGFVGQHAMSYTFNGNLCHTMSSKSVEYYLLNNKLVGEFGLRAAMAGEMGVPTIYLSGDDKACLEAEVIIPNIMTTVVQTGTGWESADSILPEKLHPIQQQDIKKALKFAEMDKISPFYIGKPITLEICLRYWYLLGGRLKKGGKRKDMKTILYESQSLEELAKTEVI
jgi:D-amino peptidase